MRCSKCGAENSDRAKFCVECASPFARRQQARSFELRASTSLARILGQQGRRSEAHKMLSDIYNWFTKRFNTADLKDTKALLEELSG